MSKSPKLDEILQELKAKIILQGRTVFLRKCDISRPELWRIITGKVIPKAETLFQMLEAANIEIEIKTLGN